MRCLSIVALSALLAAGCGEDPVSATPGSIDDTADQGGGGAGSGIDVPAADVPLPDTSEPDITDPDVAADVADIKPPASCDSEPFGAYCPCSENGDCFTGYCLQTSQGKECAEFCVEDCVDGYSCQAVGAGGGSDLNFVCVQRTTFLCMPCQNNGDCAVPGFEGLDHCVDYGDEGSFCGMQCAGGSDCPTGYSCNDDNQCANLGGICDCAPLHQQLESSTDCAVSNDFGTCFGTRQCGQIGLTLCNADAPDLEICDGSDNNCSGQIDDIGLLECGITNEFGTCPGQQACQGGTSVCQGTPPSSDTCDGKDNDCNGVADDGFPNNDDDALPDCVDPDDDNDGLVDESDNCPVHANLDQVDTDGNGAGDACDPDDDGDGSPDTLDCAPQIPFVFPFAPEVCDGVDNDCDGVTDEKSCDDSNHCTDDVCDAVLGCENLFNASPCNDGNPCTGLDKCSAGLCQGTFISCDDGNSCTDDSCDPAGGCVSTFNTLPCSDGNLCTGNDSCASGICLPGAPVICDDGNGCTINSCDADLGCLGTPLDTPCTDANPCTVDDTCQGGACSGTSKDCSDGDPCTNDSCDPDTAGGCIHAPLAGGPCDDGLPCTTGDTCIAGDCVPSVESCECTQNSDCLDDGNLCNGTPICDKSTDEWACIVDVASVVACELPGTLDAACVSAGCNSATGACFADPVNEGASCSDGDACTSGDLCAAGGCVGTSVTCDDDNPCTDQQCQPAAGCVFQVTSGFVLCDDDNACTAQDQCTGGFCVGSVPVDCDDANACTNDSCAPSAGCQHVPNTAPCSDANGCTNQDTCADSVCTGQPVNCDDGNACNGDEGCNPNTGCTSGVSLVCDDGVDCTTDGCASATGCTFAANDGLCSSPNGCLDATCNAVTGCATQPKLEGSACSDSNPCTIADSCTAGVCGGAALECSDGNTCTTDQCDPALGCIFTLIPDGGGCDDADPCTAVDTCDTGTCSGVGAVACDDGNPCTDDVCTPGVGCEGDPNTDACDDQDACTLIDVCSGGTCGGTPLDCSGDGDFDDCTDNDVCVDGACLGSPLDCSAFDTQCTEGTCSASVCSATPIDAACDDQDACTLDDACAAGSCVGAPVDCSGLDTACALGVCTDGSCSVEDISCEVLDVRLQTPAASIAGDGPTVNVRGSIGHSGPVGTSTGSGDRRVRWGYHGQISQ